jgi:hypothetical protein
MSDSSVFDHPADGVLFDAQAAVMNKKSAQPGLKTAVLKNSNYLEFGKLPQPRLIDKNFAECDCLLV